ncbi:hypothetical protein O9929_25885 [Vibrio lentus]|nr:hypothetical protein [Vibrio lentus]
MNAACKTQDIDHLTAHLQLAVVVIVGVSAPVSHFRPGIEVLARFQPSVADMLFMDIQKLLSM